MPIRKSYSLISPILLILILLPLNLTAQERYVPPSGTDWEVRSPAEAGLNEGVIEQAVEIALANENSVNCDLRIATLQAFSGYFESYQQMSLNNLKLSLI